MKKLNLTKTLLTGAVLALMTVGFTSCKKDKDDDRDKFIGEWKYNENCGGILVSDYSVTITASSTDDEKISIKGFGGFQCGGSDIVVTATVAGDDLTINDQNFCATQINIQSGNGSINGSGTSVTITYSYTLRDASGVIVDSGSCTGTYTKI
ncbi:MAG: hypothetical protein R2829_01870 [Bacteroidia bacterium]